VQELDDVEECSMSTMELDNLFEMFKWVMKLLSWRFYTSRLSTLVLHETV
jgi:hypothetical protein